MKVLVAVLALVATCANAQTIPQVFNKMACTDGQGIVNQECMLVNTAHEMLPKVSKDEKIDLAILFQDAGISHDDIQALLFKSK
jgi:hypothetical protein